MNNSTDLDCEVVTIIEQNKHIYIYVLNAVLFMVLIIEFILSTFINHQYINKYFSSFGYFIIHIFFHTYTM